MLTSLNFSSRLARVFDACGLKTICFWGVVMLSLISRYEAQAQQQQYLYPDRVMLFNDHPRVGLGPSANLMNPGQSYYATNWTHVGPAPGGLQVPPKALLAGTNHWFYATTQDGRTNAVWTFERMRTGSPHLLVGARSIAPVPPDAYSSAIQTNWMGLFRNEKGPQLTTPYYPEGIGTLYFDALNVFEAYPNTLVVEIATNMIDYFEAEYVYVTNTLTGEVLTNTQYLTIPQLYPKESERYSNNWVVLDEVFVDMPNNAPYRYQHTLNYAQAARVRIKRKTHYPDAQIEQALVAIDNIRVSFPPSGVKISKPEVICTPAYPQTGSNFTIRCILDNLNTNEYARTGATEEPLTHGRSGKLFYRWRYLDQAVDPWTSIKMSYVSGTGDGLGNGELWEATVPAHNREGDIEYYYEMECEGHRYRLYDYTRTGYQYWPSGTSGEVGTEKLLPAVLRGTTKVPAEREFSTRLRLFPSRFDTVAVVTGPPWTEENPYHMELVSNHVWRALVPIVDNQSTNFHFYFRGERKFEGTGTTFVPGYTFWSEPAQAMSGALPFGGQVVEMATRPNNNPIKVHALGGGYMQVVLDLNTYKYIACHAEYQNFNQWVAPKDVFTDSNGQTSKQRFANTFNAWPANGTLLDLDYYREYFVVAPGAVDPDVRQPFLTPNGWIAGSAQVVRERLPASGLDLPVGEILPYGNLALRMRGGRAGLGQGYVHNRSETMPNGVDTLKFRARVGQKANPFEVIYYNRGFDLYNYQIRIPVRVHDSGAGSPENPSVSIIGYYTDSDNFYELRIEQIADMPQDTPRRDKRIRLTLVKRKFGVETVLGYANPNVDLELHRGFNVKMALHTAGIGAAISTTIRCTVGSTLVAFTVEEGKPTLNALVDSGNNALSGGTVAFSSGECQAGFNNVWLDPTTSATAANESAGELILSDSDIVNLAAGAPRPYWSMTPTGRWVANASASTRAIYAVVPSQRLGVFLHPTNYKTEYEPQAPGALAWKKFGELTINGFGYQEYSIPIKHWRSHFTMLELIGRQDALQVDVIVDGLEISGWRGLESSDLSLGETDVNNSLRDMEWGATEAWVESELISGLTEGRVPGAFNTTQRSPMESVQMSTRLANVHEGWLENSTYVYNGEIYLDSGGINYFAANFDGKVLLMIDGEEIIRSDTADQVTSKVGQVTKANGWYEFEARLGFGAGGTGGPLDEGAYGGLGLAYSRTAGSTWVAIGGAPASPNLRALGKIVKLDLTREGRRLSATSGGSYTEGDWLGQAVRSPLLEQGIGMLEFEYQVIQAPAKLTVQFAREDHATLWHDVQSWVVEDAMTQFKHELAYVGTNTSGYLRVLNDRDGGTYTNAVVLIKNGVAWDEPYIADSDWRGYNVLVTDSDLERIMLDESKACFFNNSRTADTDPDQLLYNESFVKSPLLSHGIGSIVFKARNYNVGESANLGLFVTDSIYGPNAPDSEWTQVANFAIDNDFFKKYEYVPNDGRLHRAFKLATSTVSNAKRVAIEELSVVEPILPGFEIGGVIPMCVDGHDYNEERQQPLHNDDVGIQAQVTNLRENPKDIRMFVSYYVGTNSWGFKNWPRAETTTLELVHKGDLFYRTDPPIGGGIPAQEKNTVVQYHVWATYRDERGMLFTNFQERATFSNPAWYDPTDLNKTFGDVDNWSPYYIVYDIPFGAIWINEVNVKEQGGAVRHPYENQYIEIAVPAGYDLTGWKLDLVKNNRQVHTITLPSGLPVQEPVTNGYAFFVIGESEMSRPDAHRIPPLPKQDYPGGVYQLKSYLQAEVPAGIRLRRPMGMYEHNIAYDWMPLVWGMSGQNWVDSYPELKLAYVGKEEAGGSLGVVTNSIIYDLPQVGDWEATMEWTPGLPNIGQYIPNAALIAPGISNVIVMSSIVPLRGTQNEIRISPHSFRARIGESTNIVFKADAWYRFNSIKVNGLEQLNAEVETYDLALHDIQSNIVVEAAMRVRSDAGAGGLPGDILAWLMGFDDAPFAPTWYGTTPKVAASDRRELSLVEKYWIDANPTVTNYLKGGVANAVLVPATSNYYVTVSLDLNDEKLTHLLGDYTWQDGVFKLEARQPPRYREWQFAGQYKFNEYSFDEQGRATIVLRNIFENYLAGANPERPVAFRWVIEYAHMQFSTGVLTNAPALP